MVTGILPEIYSVGIVDWDVRDFHGYNTARGATYNSYIVKGEKTALIDTVKAPFAGKFLENISKVVEPGAVDYVICNHAEPDHSGAMPVVMNAMPQATIVCTKKCQAILEAYYGGVGWKFRNIVTGDTLSLGGKTFTFVEIPMVHWPDSMVTLLAEGNVLFSNDAFGQHYTSTCRFDDENPLATVMEEAKVYYANIVNPYSKRVQQVLKTAGTLKIDMICPSHGVIWRSHIPEILRAYTNWAWNKPRAKALVIFDTMWNSTAMMAEAIMEGAVVVPGVNIKLINVRKSNNTIIATELLDSACAAFGSSTLNQQMLPTIAGTMSYVRGMSFMNRAGFAFGSCGWGKGGAEQLSDELNAMKWQILHEPIKSKYRPTDDVLAVCREAGKLLADKTRELADAGGYEPLVTD